MKYDLFNPPPDNVIDVIQDQQNTLSTIKGLKYIPEFITEKEENSILLAIHSSPWLSDIKRRVQHYGWKYDYKARSIDYSMYLGKLPDWAETIAQRLYDQKCVSEVPDQVIVNEYMPGQGIAQHVDCKPCFGTSIASISLGSTLVMDFIHILDKTKIEALLERRSAVVITNESRYDWTHGIAPRKLDEFNGMQFIRKLRTSLTFRKVITNK